ncbi:MAG: hypothetical protein RLZZ524_2358 [Pseudomonadota bacterium]|jgi:hypothetical protein
MSSPVQVTLTFPTVHDAVQALLKLGPAAAQAAVQAGGPIQIGPQEAAKPAGKPKAAPAASSTAQPAAEASNAASATPASALKALTYDDLKASFLALAPKAQAAGRLAEVLAIAGQVKPGANTFADLKEDPAAVAEAHAKVIAFAAEMAALAAAV